MSAPQPSGSRMGAQTDVGDMLRPRGAGGGKLPPRPRATPRETPSDSGREAATATERPEPPAPTITAPEKRTERPRPPKPAGKRSPKTVPDDARRQIIAYMAPDLAGRLRAHGAETGRTHLQVVLDALEETHDRLSELLAAAGYIEERRSGLFGDGPRPAGRRRRTTGTDQVSLRPTVGQLRVIDKLMGDSGAPDRSVLIAVALDDYLPATS